MGSKHEQRDRKYAGIIGMQLHTLQELYEVLNKAGFTKVVVDEDHEKGWFCSIGKKPA